MSYEQDALVRMVAMGDADQSNGVDAHPASRRNLRIGRSRLLRKCHMSR